MKDERTAKRRPSERPDSGRIELRTKSGHDREEPKRQPSRIERRDWRGAGVCGDRQTD